MLPRPSRSPRLPSPFFQLLVIAALFLPFAVAAQIVAPKPLSTVSPEFPPKLKKAGKEGKAVLKVRIEADGTVGETSVKFADDPAFGEAAIAAVKAWKFEPGQRDGKPAALTVEVPFVFNLAFEERINTALKREVFVKFDEPTVDAKALKAKPKLKRPVKVSYPKSLIGTGASEDVKVEYVVNKKGEVINPAIVGTKGRDEFQLAALGAIVRYEYEPIKHEGQPVNVRMSTTIKLRDPGAAKEKG